LKSFSSLLAIWESNGAVTKTFMRSLMFFGTLR